MKRANPLAHICLLLVILIPYGLALLNHKPTVVEAVTDKQVLLDKDSLKVTSSYQIDSVKNSIDWSVHYESQAETDTKQSLKVKFSDVKKSFEDHFAKWKEDQSTGWWQQVEFRESSKGVLRFSTPMDEPTVEVSFQLVIQNVKDEGGNITGNYLSESEAGPYQLVATLPAQESSSTTWPSEASDVAIIESTSSSSVEKSNESEVQQSVPSSEAFVGPLLSGSIQSTNATALSYTDLFSYTTNNTGTFPSHNTQQFLGSGSTTDDSIKNYHYGTSSSSDTVSQYLISNEDFSLFDQGYHEYGSKSNGRINLKKSVKALGDNVFEITVDTIGDATRPLPKLDVVFLLDKSGSMLENADPAVPNVSRWTQLKEALDTFLTGMEGAQMDVGFSLVSFFSPLIDHGRKSYTHEANVDIWSGKKSPVSPQPAFGKNDYVYEDYFTRDSSALKTSKNLDGRAYDGAATPTFLGVDTALHVLSKARPEATKVLCTITDGFPTIWPIQSYYQSETADIPLDESLSSIYFSPSYANDNFNRFQTRTGIDGYSNQGLGTGSDNYTTETLPFIQARLRESSRTYSQNAPFDYKWYSVGFHTNDDANAIVRELGQDGNFKAKDVAGLVDALSQSLYPYVSTINNATLTDPMSEYVTLIKDSERLTPITVNIDEKLTVKTAEANHVSVLGIKKEVKDNQITLSNLNLGKSGSERSGVRLTYKVSLKEEYWNGKFYPANKTTYLTNGKNSSQVNYFYAVPSIKDGESVPAVFDIPLTKVIKGTATGLNGAQFGLFTQETDATPQYTTSSLDGDGQLLFSDVAPGNYWLKEIQTPNGYQTFTPTQVTVTAEGKMVGLSTYPKIENELKDVKFTVWKQKDSEKNPLPGAVFELYDKNPETETAVPIATITSTNTGEVAFSTRLKTGTIYYMKEKSAPEGYARLSGLYSIEVFESGEIRIKYDGTEVSGDDFEFVYTPGNEDNLLYLDVRNKPVKPLPRTGGAGRIGNYVLLALLLSGLLVYYLRNRFDVSQKGGV